MEGLDLLPRHFFESLVAKGPFDARTEQFVISLPPPSKP
jgi:hypothetical protein